MYYGMKLSKASLAGLQDLGVRCLALCIWLLVMLSDLLRVKILLSSI